LEEQNRNQQLHIG